MTTTPMMVEITPPNSPAMNTFTVITWLLDMWRSTVAPEVEEFNKFKHILMASMLADVGHSLLSCTSFPSTVNMGLSSERIHF